MGEYEYTWKAVIEADDREEADREAQVWLTGAPEPCEVTEHEEERRESIASNSWSVDLQAQAALTWLWHNDMAAWRLVRAQLPEVIQWQEPIRTHMDTEAMGVDAEWSSWLVDAIEATGVVWWEDGEPWVRG